MSDHARRANITSAQFDKLEPVYVFSPAGPCLKHYRLLRRNAKSCTVVYQNGASFTASSKPISWVHSTPCSSCFGEYMN